MTFLFRSCDIYFTLKGFFHTWIEGLNTEDVVLPAEALWLWFCINRTDLVLALCVAGPVVLASEEQQGAGGLPHADRSVLEGPAASHRRRLREIWRQICLLQRCEEKIRNMCTNTFLPLNTNVSARCLVTGPAVSRVQTEIHGDGGKLVHQFIYLFITFRNLNMTKESHSAANRWRKMLMVTNWNHTHLTSPDASSVQLAHLHLNCPCCENN